VFKTMLDIEITHGEPHQKETNRSSADITGLMGFTGDKRGTMSFNMSKEGILAIYTRLMQEPCDAITSEVVDAVGELTNIISGQARKELEAIGLHLTAHVPMVFVGAGASVTVATRGAIITIPFTFAIDGVSLTMNLECVFE
jgi:chemotaxis protein CheX